MTVHNLAALRRIPIDVLSADTRTLGGRPMAEIILATRYGAPASLRALSCRYKTASRELEHTGHDDIATILDVYADAALRNARHIEIGLRAIEWPPYLEVKA